VTTRGTLGRASATRDPRQRGDFFGARPKKVRSDPGPVLVPKLPLGNAHPVKLPLRLRRSSEQSTRHTDRATRTRASRNCIPKRKLGSEEKSPPFFWRIFPKSLLHNCLCRQKCCFQLEVTGLFLVDCRCAAISHRVDSATTFSRTLRPRPTPIRLGSRSRLEATNRKVTGRSAKQACRPARFTWNVPVSTTPSRFRIEGGHRRSLRRGVRRDDRQTAFPPT
jgi:hypothetical protein